MIDVAIILGALAGIPLSDKAVRAAVQHAQSLARTTIDEPAALFFAFAIRPRAVPSLNKKLATFLAREQLLQLSVTVVATDEDLIALTQRARLREVDYEDVRAWFAERMPMN